MEQAAHAVVAGGIPMYVLAGMVEEVVSRGYDLPRRDTSLEPAAGVVVAPAASSLPAAADQKPKVSSAAKHVTPHKI